MRPTPPLPHTNIQHPTFQDLVPAHTLISHTHLIYRLLLDWLLQHPLLALSLFGHPLLANLFNDPKRTTTIWRKTWHLEPGQTHNCRLTAVALFTKMLTNLKLWMIPHSVASVVCSVIIFLVK
jgi:hypothetical protein